ncbi:gliding motility-associated protein GldE [bacterium SCSIO 12643]|nr:gliding motility-associated protein GldE [bacterium SCSIO 12643]
MLLGLILLLFMSAMVSGSEVAFFSLSPRLVKTLETDGGKISSAVLELLQEPRELLATILIFNNFINVAIVLLSSLISLSVFIPADMVILTIKVSGSIQVFLINVVLITFLLLMMGEVLPKVYAAKYPIKLLRITVIPLTYINAFLIKTGITPLLVKSTRLFINEEAKGNSHKVTVNDLQHALDLTSKTNIEAEDQKILEGVVKFGNTDVKQIMTPRVKSVLIEISTPFQEVLKIIKETHFSRIPVYEDSIDAVKGVLYAKDLLPYLDRESMNWETLMREPFFVPENKKIDDLLTEFQTRKTHIAIVVDEYGGVSGMVTLEDVIEEIVGDISDEFDDDELYYSKLSKDCYVFEGQTSLINMYRALGVKGEKFENEKGEADSIAGFVLEIAGRIPLKGESIQFKNYTFTIESADRRRIKSVKVKIDSDED